ncbi:MAG: hypothetical protein A3A04_02310 [Candidatus Harrisonbacteria bacterium RIFCSPLOWO2_01_FULL_40_28]|uniref:MBL fold hydrolase n=2 Tax=Candidatus Harrisoniibacteriota TaxID=1817905 RepID=A0A1G1ZWF5_9BACT|nr:MAG: hypothetical protein A3A04_02310 [Candidatus Harrisonbacteria bacterium RIFCSPLOWO2_01_FULL_40_28]OGY68831.1 MAG: hypothetical protein A2586_02225 [Candidatus Harrisonbacteria bacterium RIFOXYD1_FULL_40_9]
MNVQFFGGARSVTGANYLLRTDNHTILVDCGLHQGSNFCERLNFEPFPYDPAKIDAVLVTHAHIDHTGRIPQLYKAGFRGSIFSTYPTRDFAEILLIDSEGILAKEAQKAHRPLLYNEADVHDVMKLWKGVEYHEPLTLGDATITFFNAGHILGSASIEIRNKGKKIVFSGDLGNNPPPIIERTEFLGDADYCLIESTYGDRLHKDDPAFKNTLEDIIEETVKAKGVLLIPAFAMERVQKLLFELNELMEHGRIPRVPIFLDSPLAIKLTDVYKKYERYFNSETQFLIKGGDAIFEFHGLRATQSTEESKAINDIPAPKVIIAGSGMSHGGRIVHHERRYLSDPKSTIVFVGYQAAGSLGRHILEGRKVVRIAGEDVQVHCRVVSVPGYSAHADQAQLIDWLTSMRQSLKKVFVVQGEEIPAITLARKIRDELAINTHIPELGEKVEL